LMLVFQEIKELLKKVGDKNSRHVFYDESVKIAEEIKVLYSEDYPKFLDLDRPKETKKDKKYRKDVYNNPVKSHYGRIVDKKMSIKNSQDYLINYPLDTTGSNPLKDYCENGFGGFGNITDWTFSIAVINESTDPNAVMCVIDKNPPERQTESYKLSVVNCSIVSFYGTGQGTELNGISEIDYIINASFKSFIDRAYREYPNWISLSETEKMAILVGYANELIQKRVSMPVLPNLSVA